MRTKVFSVFDEKAKAYSNPFFMVHNGLALRAFSDLIQDQSTMIAKHPSDFKLYCIGEFDDCEGILITLEVPEFLANAIDFVADK